VACMAKDARGGRFVHSQAAPAVLASQASVSQWEWMVSFSRSECPDVRGPAVEGPSRTGSPAGPRFSRRWAVLLGALATVVASAAAFASAARAADRVYWANLGADKISFANLDGSGGGGDLSTGGATVSGPIGVAIDPAAGRIYWANTGTDAISFANLDGSGGGDLSTSGATMSNPIGVAIDPAAGRIYWANAVADKISFANLDGSGGGGDLSTSGATVSLPVGVAIDPAAGRIYWANAGTDAISFANLDGSGGGGDLSTSGATVSDPNFPALLRAPSGAGAPAITGASAPGSALSCSQGSWAPDLLGSFLYRAPRSFAYQWTLDGSDIAGATASSYTAFVAGDYRCRVTASNQAGAGSQTSAAHAVSPPNSFTLGKLKGKKLELTVPGPGEIDVNDANAAKKKLLLKHSSATASGAVPVKVTLKLTKTAKKKLKRKGKVKVKAAITFTPTGGSANTQDKALKVKK